MAHAYEADPDLRRDSRVVAQFRKVQWTMPLRTWVYRVAHNVATSHVVRQTRGKRSGPAFLTLEEAGVQASNENAEISVDGHQALAHWFALTQRLELKNPPSECRVSSLTRLAPSPTALR